tara:strand:- start:1350 stop:2123 length:774 start_codon:yes stop_codon:yes gene_type:complete
MIDEDIKQRFKVAGIFTLQVYKIITGTMLSLFIPQSCGDKMCTLTQNYHNEEPYHKVTFYWNCFSMFLFFIYYLIELRREEWCVKYLDIDNNYPDNSLKKIIIQEKKLDKYMDNINKYYYRMLIITAISYFINLGMTIKILSANYHSNSTLSCFMSFSLLVLMKLYNSFIVAHESVLNDKMMSAYMCEFVSFNVLDKDYVQEKYNGKKNNRLEDITDIEKEIIDIVPKVSNNLNEKDKLKEDVIREEEITPIIEKDK